MAAKEQIENMKRIRVDIDLHDKRNLRFITGVFLLREGNIPIQVQIFAWSGHKQTYSFAASFCIL